jgi:hypothetical protein
MSYQDMSRDDLIAEIERLKEEAFDQAAAQISVESTRLSDALNAYSAQASKRIHAQGIDSIFGLTKGNQTLRENLQKLLGLTAYWEQFLPEDMTPFEDLPESEQQKYIPKG